MPQSLAVSPDTASEENHEPNGTNNNAYVAANVENAITSNDALIATPNSTPAVEASRPDQGGNETSACAAINRGNCCLYTKKFLESSAFSFTLGVILFVVGVSMIGAMSQMPKSNIFLIGPFSLASGTILLIRGCINEIAKRQINQENEERQQRLEEESLRQQGRDEREEITPLTRTERNERAALSQENTVIPPSYSQVALPKPAVLTATVGSQVDFSHLNGLSPARHHMSTQADVTLYAVESLVSMVSVAVDTSDLPVEPDTISQAPPSYYNALSTPCVLSPSVTVFLPTDD